MSLRDKLKGKMSGVVVNSDLYKQYGILRNPFPPAGQPSGHPHLEGPADDEVENAIQSFIQDQHSQAILLEGTQGAGKTNLLAHFESELNDLFRESEGYYIVRYFPDPEPSFSAIVRRIVQEMGVPQLANLGKRLAAAEKPEEMIEAARSHETRVMLHKLLEASKQPEDEYLEVCELAHQWLLGLRVLKNHQERLQVRFRLDTVESLTQGLRDLIAVGSRAKLVFGIFLLLDELEKQDYSVSKTVVLRYLSAMRALVDALPHHLFLLVGITPDAKRRYFTMLPAFAGRFQRSIVLSPLQDESQALLLADFYLSEERRRARQLVGKPGGDRAPLVPSVVKEVFGGKLRASISADVRGLSQRDFLEALHRAAEDVIHPQRR